MPRELIQRKVFVGGLPVRVSKEEIIGFFSQFGYIEHCQLKLNSRTKRCLGFTCLTFKQVSEAERLFGKQVEFRGRICECKRVLIKTELKSQVECERKKKILAIGLPDYLQNHDMLEALKSYRGVSHAYVVKNENQTGKNKGFGFVIFNNEEAKDSFLIQTQKNPFRIDGLEVFFSKDLTHPLQKQKKYSQTRLTQLTAPTSTTNVEETGNSLKMFQKARDMKCHFMIAPQNYIVCNAASLGTTSSKCNEEGSLRKFDFIPPCCDNRQDYSSKKNSCCEISWENNLNLPCDSSTKASILRACSRRNHIMNNYRLNGPPAYR